MPRHNPFHPRPVHHARAGVFLCTTDAIRELW